MIHDSVTVSAPGKLILMGEHAVVYQHPCLVAAINKRLYATVLITEDARLRVGAYEKTIKNVGNGKIPKNVEFIEFAIKNLLNRYQSRNFGIHVITKSDFSDSYGFGSSSAVTVCVVKALSELLKFHLTQRQIFDISYKTIIDVQGKGSGADVAAAIYGGVLYFFTAGEKIEELKIDALPLIVGYSGKKARTSKVLEEISLQMKKNPLQGKPQIILSLYDRISTLVDEARQVLEKKDFALFGKLLSANHILLQELGVSSTMLDKMVFAAVSAGAYGAKLSGAGKGDCMISLCEENKRENIEKAIKSVGGEVTHVKTNEEGVRIEL